MLYNIIDCDGDMVDRNLTYEQAMEWIESSDNETVYRNRGGKVVPVKTYQLQAIVED